MLNKELIVTRLLNERLITTEEAVILLTEEEFNGFHYNELVKPLAFINTEWVQPNVPYCSTYTTTSF